MIHTSEKVKMRRKDAVVRLERMLDRVELDRGLLIKEKLGAILNEQESSDSPRQDKDFRGMMDEKKLDRMKKNNA